MIKVLGLLVVLTLGVCSVRCLSFQQPEIVAINENEARSAVDDSIRNLLENLRLSLRCGFPGVPPLAPFHIESAKVNETGLLYNVQGKVRDFTVSGLDGYTVDVATLNVLTLRASIGLTFPKLSLNSFYGIDALLLRFIPIFGHGRLAFDVNDLSILANGRITLSLRTGRLNLTSLDIDVNMGSTFSDCSGVYDSRIVSTFFNIGLERIVRNAFDSNKENLETALENELIQLANRYLNDLTLQDLLNLIGSSDESADGPFIDPETGDLVCHVGEESTTLEYTPTAKATSTSVDPTWPDELTTFSDLPKSTENEIESDDLYSSIDHQLNESVVKLMQRAFRNM